MSLIDRLMGMAHDMSQFFCSQHMGWLNPMKWDVTYAIPRLAKTPGDDMRRGRVFGSGKEN